MFDVWCICFRSIGRCSRCVPRIWSRIANALTMTSAFHILRPIASADAFVKQQSSITAWFSVTSVMTSVERLAAALMICKHGAISEASTILKWPKVSVKQQMAWAMASDSYRCLILPIASVATSATIWLALYIVFPITVVGLLVEQQTIAARNLMRVTSVAFEKWFAIIRVVRKQISIPPGGTMGMLLWWLRRSSNRSNWKKKTSEIMFFCFGQCDFAYRLIIFRWLNTTKRDLVAKAARTIWPGANLFFGKRKKKNRTFFNRNFHFAYARRAPTENKNIKCVCV